MKTKPGLLRLNWRAFVVDRACARSLLRLASESQGAAAAAGCRTLGPRCCALTCCGRVAPSMTAAAAASAAAAPWLALCRALACRHEPPAGTIGEHSHRHTRVMRRRTGLCLPPARWQIAVNRQCSECSGGPRRQAVAGSRVALGTKGRLVGDVAKLKLVRCDSITR